MVLEQEIVRIIETITQAIPVARIYLFGSYARNTPGENSDYDFFIVIPDGDLRPLEATQKARRALSTLNRKTPVDILADYQSRFDERKQFNTLERRVWNEGVVLYERK